MDDQRQRRAVVPLTTASHDCERVMVTAGGAAGTSDGDARSGGVVSTAGS